MNKILIFDPHTEGHSEKILQLRSLLENDPKILTEKGIASFRKTTRDILPDVIIIFPSTKNIGQVNLLLNISPKKTVAPTIKELIKVVCEHYNTTPEEILITRRKRDIVLPRQVIMYLADIFTNLKPKDIGHELGGKERTTVLHGIQTIKDLIDSDVEMRGTISELDTLIRSNLKIE